MANDSALKESIITIADKYHSVMAQIAGKGKILNQIEGKRLAIDDFRQILMIWGILDREMQRFRSLLLILVYL